MGKRKLVDVRRDAAAALRNKHRCKSEQVEAERLGSPWAPAYAARGTFGASPLGRAVSASARRCHPPPAALAGRAVVVVVDGDAVGVGEGVGVGAPTLPWRWSNRVWCYIVK